MNQVNEVKKFVASERMFSWDLFDWKDLPNLHHIVSRLAKVPLSSIVSCSIVEKTDWADLSTAQIIDGFKLSKGLALRYPN
jgi:hypothetical protein